MSIISVPNLKEIETWESYFYAANIRICNFVQRRKTKKIGQLLGTITYLKNAEVLSDM